MSWIQTSANTATGNQVIPRDAGAASGGASEVVPFMRGSAPWFSSLQAGMAPGPICNISRDKIESLEEKAQRLAGAPVPNCAIAHPQAPRRPILN